MAQAENTYARVADEIRTTFECSLHTLDPDIQRHYAVRIYRITGDTSLIYPILFDVSLSIEQLGRDLDSLNDERYFERRTAELYEPFARSTRKAQIRGKVLKTWQGELLYLNLLTQANKLQDYGLDSSRFAGLFDRTKQVIISHNFGPFLLDSQVVRVFGPQAVNYVYYLQGLGVNDLRQQYTEVVRRVFSDSLDRKLEADQFGDKVYALTHMILAASRYYQVKVDTGTYSWIASYFSAQAKRILKETSPDIIAEVGLCYCLLGKEDDNLVEECRKLLVKKYDKEEKLIPSILGKTDLEQGEHRNVLAIMLLIWPTRLHPGPNLPSRQAYQSLFEDHILDNAD